LKVSVSVERQAAGNRFVQDDAQRKQIGQMSDLFPARSLLRRHVVDRPQKDPRLRQTLARALRRAPRGGFEQPARLGETEIENLDPASAGDHYVGRFDVAMDDTALVSLSERLGSLLSDVDDEFHGQRSLADP